MSRLFFCVALLGVAACVPSSPQDSFDAPASAFDGAWRVRVVPVAHGCPEVGDLSPLRGGHLRLEEDGDTLELLQPGAEPLVLSHVGARTWGVSESAVLGGCAAETAWWWTITDSGATALAATLTGTWETRGACQLPTDHCTVTYAVHGVR